MKPHNTAIINYDKVFVQLNNLGPHETQQKIVGVLPRKNLIPGGAKPAEMGVLDLSLGREPCCPNLENQTLFMINSS